MSFPSHLQRWRSFPENDATQEFTWLISRHVKIGQKKWGKNGKGASFFCRKKTQVLRSSVSSNFKSFRGLLQNRNRLFVWQDNFWDTKLAATFANRAHPECKKRDGGCPCEGRAFWLWWHWLGGGFKYFFNVHPYLRKWSNYIWLYNTFQMGWNHHL